jgi:CheY-like chemotaxis protein
VDGVTATKTIRRTDGPNRQTPIVALTAHALDADLERFSKAGVTATIVKPLTKDALERVLANSFVGTEDTCASGLQEVVKMLSEQLGRDETTTLLDQFTHENDNLVTLLKIPLDAREARLAAAHHVHKSAGSASVYQTEELSRCLKELETLLRQNKHVDLSAAKRRFEDAWSRTRSELQACRSSLVGQDKN